MIDDVTKQQILDAAQIVDVVSEYVQLRKKGSNFVGLCPFHNDRRPSFNVSPSKNICKCFVCEEGGTPVTFLMKIEHKTYTEALKQLAAKYNIPIEEREETEEDRKKRSQREQQFVANAFAAQFFEQQLRESSEGKSIALPYLVNRGIPHSLVEKFGIGYAPSGRDELVQAALQAGHKIGPFAEVGLCYLPDEKHKGAGSDRFRERIIFPIHTVSGRVVGFGGRIMSSRPDAKQAKYINSPESLIYNKGTELYGIFFAKRDISKLDKCLIVEGYMDVIALHQVGICNVVATSGTALTDKQIRLIRRFTQNVTVIFDGDAAGIKAAFRGIDLLLHAGLNIKVLLLPDGHDPDSFSRSLPVEEVQRFFSEREQDFISFKSDLLSMQVAQDPQLKASVINDILHSISLVPEAIQRTIYLQETSQRFGLDEQLLLSQVKRMRATVSTSPIPTITSTEPLNISTATKHSENDSTPDGTASYTPGTSGAEVLQTSGSQDPLSTPLASYEKALISLIVRYGEVLISLDYAPETEEPPHTPLEEEEEEKQIPIASLIAQELESDGITLGTPIFKQIIAEAHDLLERGEVVSCSKYFSNHPSSYVSSLAIDLLSSRYKLSRRARSMLGLDEDEIPSPHELREQTIREIYTFKTEYIVQCIRNLQQQIKEAQRCGKMDNMPTLLQKLMQLNEVKIAFAAELGERVIIP